MAKCGEAGENAAMPGIVSRRARREASGVMLGGAVRMGHRPMAAFARFSGSEINVRINRCCN